MNAIAPQFIVNSIQASVEFYTEKLGFDIDWIHKENPKFAILNKNGATIMLRELKKEGFVRPNRVPFTTAGWHTSAAEAWDAYIWVEDVETLYEQYQKNKVSIIKTIQDTDYGNRDFEIEDINGYILCFGMSL